MDEVVINMEEVGARLRDLRHKQHKTQVYFADMLYITPSYLALIEGGKRSPNVDVLVRAARLTNVTLEYLLFGIEEEPPGEVKEFERLCHLYPPDDIKRALRLAKYYLRLTNLKDPDEEIE